MIKHEINKGNLSNTNKKINLNALKKIPKNILFSFEKKNNKKLNFKIKSYNISSNGNNNKNIKYLNYRQKLLNKCNSQIYNNKILPILTNNHNNNHRKISFSLGDKSLTKNIPSIKTPKILEKSNSQINKIIIPYLSNNQNKNQKEEEKNKDIYQTINTIKDSNHLNKINENENSENNEKINNNKNEINKVSSSNLKKSNLDEKNPEKKNNNNNENPEKEEIGKEENKIIQSYNSNENIEKLSKDLLPRRKTYKFCPYKFSKFFKISKNRNVSARNIYEYYISEDLKENNLDDPIDNFTKFVEKKYRNPNKKFNKLYGINKSYLIRLQEIKNNNSIAYKDDFNLQEYQKILCGMIRKRVRSDNIYILKEDYKKFNEKLNKGFLSHKGRFSQLAEKIRYNAPSYLVNKLKKLDEDKLKAKAKYFNININKRKNNDVDYAIEDFDFYLENKFIPNIDNNKM